MATINDSHHHGDVKGQLDRALAYMKTRGERITLPRRRVLKVLVDHHDHLSAEEIAARIDGEDVHRATVYRILDRFADLGIVSVRQLQGEAAAYHLAVSEHLHGHCRGCGAVTALPPEAFETLRAALTLDAGFQLDLHRSTLTGLCLRCSA